MMPSAEILRTRDTPKSPTKTFRPASTASARGAAKAAARAGPPSPEKPRRPDPAIVEITPLESTRRTRTLNTSFTYTLPDASAATPTGSMNAVLAGMPSLRENPPPTTVEMIPAGDMLRTRRLALSAIRRFPCESKASPNGAARVALIAGPPSPENAGCPVPATVVMMPLRSIFLMRFS